MPTEHALDSVLEAFLADYVRPDSDPGGHALFALLMREWRGPFEFDLLALPPPLIAESKTEVVAEARAISSFREQMAKTGTPLDTLARASLVIDRSEPSRGGEGSEVRVRAAAETRSGSVCARERSVVDDGERT